VAAAAAPQQAGQPAAAKPKRLHIPTRDHAAAQHHVVVCGAGTGGFQPPQQPTVLHGVDILAGWVCAGAPGVREGRDQTAGV
jgi:hypothetical protein